MQGEYILFSLGADAWAWPMAEALGCRFYELAVHNFADGESFFTMPDGVVADCAGRDVLVLVRFHASQPCDTRIFQLLLAVSALKNFKVRSITVLAPYLPYARQELSHDGQMPGNAPLLRQLLASAGADSIITCDIHQRSTLEIAGGFVRHIALASFWAGVIDREIKPLAAGYELVLVAPDQGALVRANELALTCHLPVVSIAKQRSGVNQVRALHLNADVSGKHAIIIDDILDTGGTAVSAHALIKECGAAAVYGLFSHAVSSGPLAKNLEKTSFEKIFVTDSLCIGSEVQDLFSVASLQQFFAQQCKGLVIEQSLLSARLL